MLLLSGSPRSLFVVGVYALACSSSVSALTNAGKARNGISSLVTRFGRFIPGRDAFERSLLENFHPSASSASAAPAPAPTSVSLQGSIEVRAVSNNTKLGFLSNTPQGLNGLTNNEAEKLSVILESSGSSRAPVNIVVQNPHFTGAINLGGITVSRNASSNLSVGSNNTILLSNVAQTAPGSRPVPTSQGAIASAIWTVNASTWEIKAHWINSNGQLPVTHIISNRSDSTLYLTGDPAPVDSDLTSVAFFLDSVS